jgi:hypothetical protein
VLDHVLARLVQERLAGEPDGGEAGGDDGDHAGTSSHEAGKYKDGVEDEARIRNRESRNENQEKNEDYFES